MQIRKETNKTEGCTLLLDSVEFVAILRRNNNNNISNSVCFLQCLPTARAYNMQALKIYSKYKF